MKKSELFESLERTRKELERLREEVLVCVGTALGEVDNLEEELRYQDETLAWDEAMGGEG